MDFEFKNSQLIAGKLDAQSRIDNENQAVKYVISKIRAEVKANGNMEK